MCKVSCYIAVTELEAFSSLNFVRQTTKHTGGIPATRSDTDSPPHEGGVHRAERRRGKSPEGRTLTDASRRAGLDEDGCRRGITGPRDAEVDGDGEVEAHRRSRKLRLPIFGEGGEAVVVAPFPRSGWHGIDGGGGAASGSVGDGAGAWKKKPRDAEENGDGAAALVPSLAGRGSRGVEGTSPVPFPPRPRPENVHSDRALATNFRSRGCPQVQKVQGEKLVVH